MHKWTEQEIRIHVRGVIVLLFAMIAISMLSEVSRQNWNSKVTAYPTKTEAAQETYARQLMGAMTLEQKVGQMFFASDGIDGETAAPYHLGGVLLHTEQLEALSKNEVSVVLRGYQEAGEIPMLVAVNEEGGLVNTVSALPQIRQKAFLSPRELLTTGGLKLVDADAREKSDLLRELGFNMNFAPVCDVVEDDNGLMFLRSAKGDGDDVARYAETVVSAMQDRRVIAVMKYFPGYGDLPAKEYTEVLVDQRSTEELTAQAFAPYVRGIDAGAQVVMMGNTIVTAVDETRPGSLSQKVHNLLRRELGFEGVIVSGDLNAMGMGHYGNAGELAVQAISAGSDMLLTKDYAEGIEAVVHAVHMGILSEERVEESVLRILKLKISNGVME